MTEDKWITPEEALELLPDYFEQATYLGKPCLKGTYTNSSDITYTRHVPIQGGKVLLNGGAMGRILNPLVTEKMNEDT